METTPQKAGHSGKASAYKVAAMMIDAKINDIGAPVLDSLSITLEELLREGDNEAQVIMGFKQLRETVCSLETLDPVFVQIKQFIKRCYNGVLNGTDSSGMQVDLEQTKTVGPSQGTAERFSVHDQANVNICGPIYDRETANQIFCLLCSKAIDSRSHNIKRHMKSIHKFGDVDFTGFLRGIKDETL